MACCLIVSITFETQVPRVCSVSGVEIEPRVGALVWSAMLSAVRKVISKTSSVSLAARGVVPPTQLVE